MEQWLLPAGVTDAEGLVLREVPVPEPGPGEVRITVRAVSINARDALILAGPFGRAGDRDLVPLSDVAGEIDAVGEGVTQWAVGDRVTDLHFAGWDDGPAPDDRGGVGLGADGDDGVLAEQVVLRADRVTRMPANLSFAEASALPVAGVTAWNAVMGRLPVGPGDTVVVIGSGGVALFALQIATAAGARVVAMGRREEQGERLLAMGATDFVNGTTVPGWAAELAGRCGGAAKVVNTIGMRAVGACLPALAGGGEVAVVGLVEHGSATLDGDALLGRELVVRGVSVGSHRMHRDLVALVEREHLRPVIDRTFPFSKAPEAFRAQAGGGLFGKLVIEVA
ncbi:MAG: Alcohol dehydrogenase [uncultured Quadrisphaera sp.]|uniref:Alcohol dehydrogenase n=1 Tax=uncultured Quadrisphaera sp. TaxID=904978 RepID=A0A6J4PWA9_9ACTN|nr:MAG: Alcohol dehydrogenase [uncultured Quadrisphaera sp.]